MKWILAGLAFALLVGLAVFTVAVRTKNLVARGRIAAHNDEIMSLRVERARQELHGRGTGGPSELIQRLRDLTGTTRKPQ